MTEADIDEINRRIRNALLAFHGHTFKRDVTWIDQPVTQSKLPHIDELLTPMVEAIKSEMAHIAAAIAAAKGEGKPPE